MTGQIQEENAPWSKLIFHGWIGALLRVGQRRPIELSDLHPVPPTADSLQTTAPLFRAAFRGSVLKALFAAFRQRFINIFLLLILMTALNLLRPLLLKELIARFNPASSSAHAWFFSWIDGRQSMAAFATLCFLCLALIRSHFLRHCFKLTWSMPGLLRYEVYESLLHLSPEDRSRLTTGEFVNIATRDCDSTSILPFLLEPLLYPVTILLYCGMLVSFLGPWALLAVVALAAVVPLGRRLEKRMSDLAAQVREQARMRLGILGEILTGIRVIKFHAWEERFMDRVLTVRQKEVSLMRERARVAARHSALTALLPILTGASVVTLVAWTSGVPSTAEVFASFSVIASLVSIFSEIPDLLQNGSELKISVGRIGAFLSQRFADENQLPLRDKTIEIELTQADFSRPEKNLTDSSPLALKKIDLKVPVGCCVAVVGSIGSGKSTLLRALLGEMVLRGGTAAVPHPVSFAPQLPWNQNASVRDNIVFQLETDESLLQRVVRASALQTDLSQWPAGFETEVGERGINLSGGQKQRLALARTAYTSLKENVGCVIWDDPFSALDEHVASHVFEHLLQKELVGKTRIFSTHRIDFALKADWIVVLDDGMVVEQGAPARLVQASGPFARLHDLHIKTRGHELQTPSQAEEPTPLAPAASQSGKLTTEEKITLPVFNKVAFKSYFNALAPALGLWGVVVVFFLPRLTDISSNLWLGHWTSHPNEVALSTAVLVFALLTFVTVAAERTRSVILFDGGVKAGTSFFESLLGGVMNAPMRFFDTSPQGRILNRFTSDTNAIDNSMPSSVGQFLTALIGIFASLLPVVWSQPAASFLLLPAAFLYFVLFRWVRKTQLRLNALSQVVRSPWMSLTAETLPGLTVIQSLQSQKRFLDRYKTLINRHISTGFYMLATNLWFALRLELLGVVLVGGFLALLTLHPDSASPALSAVGLTFSLQMVGILGGVARSLRMLENSLVSVDRVSEYAALPSEPQSLGGFFPENWPSSGSIAFKNLTASYAENLPPVLKNISLEISGGKKIGITGRTGSGKSTLFLILTRLIPVPEGMVFIDGVDIATLPLKTLRNAVTVIPQDPVLFSGSLRENLDPFEQHSDDAVSTALRRGHLLHICSDAEKARNFTVEENGKNLSVGERQLVCLARALLSQSRILLIDEATANVDVATDALIQQTLREEFKHCTQLVIAHRTNTLSDADHIIRLENGSLTSFE
ncbi:MAG: hypothetical protein RIR26_2131 [Pseudomonadota bacterium]